MQKRFLFLSTMAIVSILFFSSCSSKTNKEGLFVPKTASVVVHFNTAAITTKLSWDDIKKSEFFTRMYSDTSVSSYVRSAMDNPANTGIDIKKDLLFFVEKDSLGGYVVIEGLIKDAGKFKQFSEASMKGATASDRADVHFLSQGKTTASWNTERFIIIVDAPEMNYMNRRNFGGDNSMLMPARSYRDGTVAAAALYKLKEDNSLGKDEKFSNLMNTKGDVHFWFNGEAFSPSSIGGMAALGMMNLSKLTEGSVVAGTANFENGKIVADLHSYSGKELSDLWKKYNGNKINSDMVKRLPSKDVAAFFALNFKPEGIRELIKLAGLEGFANMGAGYAGFTLDDFIKANKGDIMIAISDITKDTMGKRDMNFIFSTSIADKNAFGKLVTAGKKYADKNLVGIGVPQIFYDANDNYFAIGNKKESIDEFIATETNNSFDFFSKISGSPVGGFVNFQYIFKAMKDNKKMDSIHNAMFATSAAFWDNLIMSGGEFKDGAINQHVEVSLMDKNINSLKQLSNYLSTMATLSKRQKAQREKDWGNDVMMPMIDTAVSIVPAK